MVGMLDGVWLELLALLVLLTDASVASLRPLSATACRPTYKKNVNWVGVNGVSVTEPIGDISAIQSPL